MKIKYNAPTTLTFAFFCTLVVLLDQFAFHGLTRAFFTVPNALAFDLAKPVNYVRLFTHIAGHADWSHLVTNLAYILLLGPMLEESYGSLTMLLMMVVTGFVTGVLNACFFPHPLLGASGIVFMMILLASFANHGRDDIPLTFILIVILYLGREILDAFRGDDISQFAHLAGGLCGSLFGFFQPTKARSPQKKAATPGSAPAKARVSKATTARSQASQAARAQGSRAQTAQPPARATAERESRPRQAQAKAKSGDSHAPRATRETPARGGSSDVRIKRKPSGD